MTEPVKVIATDGDAEAHLDQRLMVDRARIADAEGFRRIERTRRHEHRGEADERVEGGDELRHRRHGDAAGGHRADCRRRWRAPAR